MYVCKKARIAHSVHQADCRLDSPALESQREARDFSHLQNVQTGCGTHPPSYSMGTVVISLGVKQPGHDIDHSPSSSAEVKNECSNASTPFTVCTGTLLCYVNI
jgi:hypothetical protein